MLDIVGVHLKHTFGQIVAVFDDHKHAFLSDEFLNDSVYELLHLFGFLHVGDVVGLQQFGEEEVAEVLL